MPTDTTKHAILALLTKAQHNLPDLYSKILATDNASLTSMVIAHEFEQEIVALHKLTKSDDWIEPFKTRCKERAALISNSCLSFTARPEGVCNTLYANIAILLFQPKTLGELLTLVLPDAIYLHSELLPDEQVGEGPKLRLNRQELSSLTEPPDLKILANFVLVDNFLLDSREIANFDIHLHQIFYTTLNQAYPKLAIQLYQHNQTLRALGNDLWMARGEGPTPLEVLRSYVAELGRVQTNTPRGKIIVCEMDDYMKSLPQTVKDELLGMPEQVGKQIEQQVKYLKESNGAYPLYLHTGGYPIYLHTIFNNSANYPVLTKHPILADSELLSLQQKYGPTHPLLTTSGGAVTDLPSDYLKQIASRIGIGENYERSFKDLLSILLSFPPALYKDLLHNIQVSKYYRLNLPGSLGEMIQRGVLNQEQQTAWDEALICEADRFGGIFQVFHCLPLAKALTLLQDLPKDRISPAIITPACLTLLAYSAHNNLEFFEATLRLFKQTEIFTLLTTTRSDQYETVLHAAAENPKSFEVALKLLPLYSLYHALMTGSVRTVLHNVVQHPESIRAILALDKEAFWRALKDIDDSDKMCQKHHVDKLFNTVLHSAAKNWQSFETILGLYPPEQRLEKLTIRGPLGENTLIMAVQNIDTLKVMLRLLSPKDWIKALKIRSQLIDSSSRDETLLQIASRHPEYLQAILKVLSKKTLLDALQVHAGFMNKTALHTAVDYPESLKIILDFLPTKKHIAALIGPKKEGAQSALHYAASSQAKSLAIILEYHNTKERLSILQEKDIHPPYSTVLFCATENPDPLALSLALYPEGKRLAVSQMVYGGLLSPEILHLRYLKLVLSLLSEKDLTNVANLFFAESNHARLSRNPNLSLSILASHNNRDFKQNIEIANGKFHLQALNILFEQGLAPDYLSLVREDPHYALMKAQIHEHLVGKDRSLQTETAALNISLSILGWENNLSYNAETDLFEGIPPSDIKMSPAQLVLTVYLNSNTDSHKDLMKALLTAHNQPEDYLALAIIAQAEESEKQKGTYIHQFISSCKKSSRYAAFFSSANTKPNPEEFVDLCKKLSAEKPATKAFIDAYKHQIDQIVDKPKAHQPSSRQDKSNPFQSKEFDDKFDNNFPL